MKNTKKNVRVNKAQKRKSRNMLIVLILTAAMILTTFYYTFASAITK